MGTAAVDPSVVIGGMVCNGVGFFFSVDERNGSNVGVKWEVNGIPFSNGS